MRLGWDGMGWDGSYPSYLSPPYRPVENSVPGPGGIGNVGLISDCSLMITTSVNRYIHMCRLVGNVEVQHFRSSLLKTKCRHC